MSEPLIVLCEPQMGENIGAVARAMLNCALTRLCLVNPRDGWPNEKAVAMAAGADVVLENAVVCANLEEALAGQHFVLATTARPRDMVKPILTPEKAIAVIEPRIHAGQQCAIVFGGERSGLSNDHLSLVDAIISIPINPQFSSLNLAQAALIMGYEWYRQSLSAKENGYIIPIDIHQPAPKEAMHHLFLHLEKALDAAGFFTTPQMRPNMVRNLRNLLQRSAATGQEIRSFHGIITALSKMGVAHNPQETDS
ncbi:MAG: RNA methyltransferase [Alphaproteobacteria bacterium]